MILFGPAAGGVQFFWRRPARIVGARAQTHTQPLGRYAANCSTAARPNLAGSSWAGASDTPRPIHLFYREGQIFFPLHERRVTSSCLCKKSEGAVLPLLIESVKNRI